jgi:cysteine-rich repeat protein
MRSLFLRCSLSFALAWTAACADDVPTEVVTTESSSGDDSTTGPGPVSADSTRGPDTTEGPDDTSEGSTSSSSGETTGPACGNDQIDGDESCDGTDLDRAECTTFGFMGGTIGCLPDCSGFDTSRCEPYPCGDDQIDPRQACDGTNLAGEDCISQGFEAGTLACTRDCSAFDTSGCTLFSCGNDLTEGVELCDGLDLAGEDCGSQGFDAGTLGCAPDCTAFDTSACTSFSCGNDLIEGVEVCDGTGLAAEDCISQGFDAGTLGCALDCTAFDTSACFVITCGDDVIDGSDVCDGIDLAGQDCVSQGFDAGTLACLADCTAFDTSACITFSCGNDILEGIEVCDGSALAGADCVGQGFDGGTLACLPDCTAYDTAGCYACGDDVTAGPEVCDGADLAGSDCVAQGFDGGTLACVPDCSAFDTAGCYVCGDDVTAGPEICDGSDLAGSDCVAQGFDGGALACQLDCSAFDVAGCYVCGDDVAAGPESCDGVDLLGNDCLDVGFDGGTLACDAACAFDTSGCTICGDGVIAGTEQCDGANLGGQSCVGLGFQFGTLGCTNGCNLSQIHCVDVTSETEPNDDGMVAPATNDFLAPAANGPFTTDQLISATINPVGDDDVFAISNPGPGYTVVSLETYGPVPLACDAATDTQMFLLAPTGLQLAFDDNTGIANCSLLSNVVIPPGVTLYVRIIEAGDNAALAGGYHLHIRFDPVVCGDDLAGPGEQCEDGNTANGDGCSATCVLEGAIQEIEPNGTGAQADANGIVISDDAFLAGGIGPALGDVDRFRINLAAPQQVRFETFTTLGQCNGGFATTLRLFDETGNNSFLPTYVLEVQMLGDAGTEGEPNEDQANASLNLTGGVSDVYVFGDHSVGTDSDYYAIDVPVDGSSLRLEVVEGDRAIETCEGLGIDSQLTLFNSAGMQLVTDNDDGRGLCSVIDGTGFGTTPQDLNAHDLAAGTYFVQVGAPLAAQAGASGQFIYRLVATVRQP